MEDDTSLLIRGVTATEDHVGRYSSQVALLQKPTIIRIAGHCASSTEDSDQTEKITTKLVFQLVSFFRLGVIKESERKSRD